MLSMFNNVIANNSIIKTRIVEVIQCGKKSPLSFVNLKIMCQMPKTQKYLIYNLKCV